MMGRPGGPGDTASPRTAAVSAAQARVSLPFVIDSWQNELEFRVRALGRVDVCVDRITIRPGAVPE